MWYLLPSGNTYKIETISLSLDRFLNMIQTEEYIMCTVDNYLFLSSDYTYVAPFSVNMFVFIVNKNNPQSKINYYGINVLEKKEKIINEISHRNILS